ncbi:hypothetical protein H4R26_000336 [Coemansia thaxteri]|uniref:RRM domain-containing protein n=1 Tax=Coemansia thaxteri TaxID=2663907 RepID=A0A9W8BQ31_9FUNG|nr:hypothetical protein H4R26_000336 [Coemansia thaxteri]KAJ2487408.1 hypothetical protein EV174_000528 [Coemansia sp. RSA 2320]
MAYAQELQQTVFKNILEEEPRLRGEEARKLPACTVNPGLLAGVDVRNMSVMSRIYVGSINFELNDEQLKRVFSEFGSVCSVSMSKDPATGRHKGFGFIEYDVPEAATLAMEVMNGTMLGGRQLKIGRPNNYSLAVTQGFPAPPAERIYVANVNEAISEDVLREIFAPFGQVNACVLAVDIATRKHKGWGFIEFAEEAPAEQAALAMNGFSLGNLVLRVRRCVVGGPLGEGMAALGSVSEVPEAAAGVSNNVSARPPQQVIDVAASINSIIGEAAAGPSVNHVQRPATPPAMSPIVLLENVVGGRSEVDDELAADMEGEGKKCGAIAKVVVHITSEQELATAALAGEVSIFFHFKDAASAVRAVEMFDRRWFAGRQVAARLFDMDQYRVLTSADTMVYIPEAHD